MDTITLVYYLYHQLFMTKQNVLNSDNTVLPSCWSLTISSMNAVLNWYSYKYRHIYVYI